MTSCSHSDQIKKPFFLVLLVFTRLPKATDKFFPSVSSSPSILDWLPLKESGFLSASSTFSPSLTPSTLAPSSTSSYVLSLTCTSSTPLPSPERLGCCLGTSTALALSSPLLAASSTFSFYFSFFFHRYDFFAATTHLNTLLPNYSFFSLLLPRRAPEHLSPFSRRLLLRFLILEWGWDFGYF